MKNLKTIFGFIISFLIGLLIIETYLQLAEIGTTSTEKKDKLLGTKLISNKNYLFHNEGFSIGKINKFGYYGHAYKKNKSTDSLKISLIGDSFVEAIQVFERHHFGYKLEKLLNSSNNKFQVLNFGRSGFNLNDSYCYFENFVKYFNTDINLVFISPGDLLIRDKIKNRPNAYLDNGKLKIDYSPNYKYNTSLDFFRGKSIILGYLNKTFQKIKTWNSNYPKENEKSLQKLTDVQKKIILHLSKNNSTFVIHYETTNEKYNYLLDDFISFSIENKINIIYLNELFEDLNKKNVNYNYWPLKKIKGHFNIDGHNEIANYLYSILKND